LARFPNETAHNKAREQRSRQPQVGEDLRGPACAARVGTQTADGRGRVLCRQAAADQLRTQLDANDAATDAQRQLIQNQQAEIIRVNALYDAELQRLRKLWGGAQPGTMGALPPNPAASATAPRKAAGK